MKKLYRQFYDRYFIRKNSIYIYPNKFGTLFFALFALSLMMGATYENNMLYLFGFILLALLFIFILITAAEVRSVKIGSVYVESGFPEASLSVNILVSNTSDKWLQVGLGVKRHLQTSLALEAKTSRRVTLKISAPSKRGVYKLDRVQIFTSGPLQFFNCWTYHYPEVTYYVYPQPMGHQLPDMSWSQDPANISGLDDFTGRESVAQLSWRHYAKYNKLMIKAYEKDIAKEYDFNLAEMDGQDIEMKLSQVSRWVCDAETQNIPYRLYTNQMKTIFSTGRIHKQKILKHLAVFENE